MKKLLPLLAMLMITAILPVSVCEATVTAPPRTFMNEFSGGEWEGGKVTSEPRVLNFYGSKDDGTVDIMFYKNQNGKTSFIVLKENQIIGLDEFPALYGLSVKHIQEVYTGKSFFIVSLAYDTSFAKYLVMGYDAGEWYVYIDSKDFYDPTRSDYTSLDVNDGSLQLIYGEMGRSNTRKQIYEFGYNLDTRTLNYKDKGIIRD